MKKIVLYCKSYRNDLERVKILYDSIQKYNVDNIPFYISVPQQDITLFKIFTNAILIPDEALYNVAGPGWIIQQIIKSSLWRLNVCENYVLIDSDSYFIKPFKVSDFMYNEDVPYTVMHEQKELFSWSISRTKELGFDPKDGFMQDRKKIMDLFRRESRYYDFGPTPSIWNCSVWKTLEEEYCKPNNLTFTNLIEFSPSELSWYGESLLAFKSIEIYPIEPLFKVFHYPQQYNEYKQQNITEEMIAQNYFGIILQSNWKSPLKF